MDSNCCGCHSDVPDTRDILSSHEGKVLPIPVEDNVADHGDVGAIHVQVSGKDKARDAYESDPIHIPTVGSVSPELWGVRVGYLLAFIAGIIFSWVAQFVIAVLAVGP